MGKRKRTKFEKIPVPDVEHKNGDVVFNIESNLGNGDWIRTWRLQQEGKDEEVRKRFETRAFKLKEI